MGQGVLVMSVPHSTRQGLINYSVMLTFNEHLRSACYGRVQFRELGCQNEHDPVLLEVILSSVNETDTRQLFSL